MANDWQDLTRTTTVFTRKPNWVENPISTFDTNSEFINYPGTQMDIYNLSNSIGYEITYRYSNLTKDDEYYIINFFINRQGMLKRFWLPWWKNSFRLAQNVSIDDSVITIQHCRYNKIDQGYERIFILLKTGDYISRKVVAVVENYNYESIILQTPMNKNINQDDILFFGRLLLVRFADDELNLDFSNNKISDLSIKYKELPNEYELEEES